ncbi:hypothetical protein B8W95_12820, partial [Staphylococcus pasteuri]
MVRRQADRSIRRTGFDPGGLCADPGHGDGQAGRERRGADPERGRAESRRVEEDDGRLQAGVYTPRAVRLCPACNSSAAAAENL